jgi:hypothetical protein
MIEIRVRLLTRSVTLKKYFLEFKLKNIERPNLVASDH